MTKLSFGSFGKIGSNKLFPNDPKLYFLMAKTYIYQFRNVIIVLMFLIFLNRENTRVSISIGVKK